MSSSRNPPIVSAQEPTSSTPSPTAQHLWFERFGLTCCKRCGIVKRRVGENKPCPGPVRIGLRDRVGGDRFAGTNQPAPAGDAAQVSPPIREAK
jgi:hypothetical protein